ncbi:phage tail protein [Sphingomonas sp. PAMC 26617]|uniref:phage tail protein n=1 Tax=Sphingomonas sp. PAMC 26617 TaxID=1112216 RepID=UPI000289B124|nr:phage tail protein [Sphingomonas sp. PAMC 26617]
MATLILSAVGTAIGGPVGGAIGAVIGNAIDHTVLFPAKGRSGPRLSALQVQTSSYGTPLQRVFGTMRIGGCVIWSTELIESTGKSGGGKGQPSTTTYSYSVSFAVALSARRIGGVGRIWADGKLLRGADGVFKSATGFRLHDGSEDQPVDPLLAAAEGVALTPAHRGLAYVVFEHFQLADYGNRIPQLTFEVIADAAPVTVGRIATELSDGVVMPEGDTLLLTGFAAYGDSVRSVIEPLAQASGGWFAPAPGLSDDGLILRGGSVPERVVAQGDTVAPGATQGTSGRSIAALETVARQVSVSHYDPARDFQIGMQRARRPGPGTRDDQLELAATIAAGPAKTVAEQVLAQAEAGRERRTVTFGRAALGILPGTRVTIQDVAGVWRVTRWAFEREVVTLECVRLAARTAAATASPGRVLPAPDMAVGTTLLSVFEALPFDDTLLAAPRLTVVAAGTAPGWRRAALLYSTDGGARWQAAGTTALPGVIGRVVTLPAAANAALLDRGDGFEVDLAHAEMVLSGADAAALGGGVNLALVGDELLQFGSADQIGATRWRLSRLWRGRRATEAAISTQRPGDRFALLTPDTASTIDLPPSALGTTVQILATGPGDVAGPATAAVLVSGTSVVPPSPVLLRSRETGDGSVTLTWVRRSRTGWHWVDAVDAPLAEEREAYRVTLGAGGNAPRDIVVFEPGVVLAPDDRRGGSNVAVRQTGANGESRAAEIHVPAWTA